MDYEKKYKERLDATRYWHSNSEGDIPAVLEEIFPELKESEDERIKREIIDYIKIGTYHKNWIAWLEKQGEKKEYTFKSIPRLLDMIEPTDRAKAYCQKLIDTLAKEGYNIDAKIVGECLKTMNGEDVPMAIMDEKQREQKSDMVEPKFKVGDWIVNNQTSTNYLVKSIRDDEYCLWPLDAKIEGFLRIVDVDSEYHLWTIQDAKDGDVVVDKSIGIIGIFESIGHHPDGGSCNDPSYCFLHCRYDDGFFYADFENGNTIDSDDLIPATKEQRDLLFKKMKEAGYEWDSEKKELKKISQRMILAEAKEAIYDKPAWSEENEKILAQIEVAVLCRPSQREDTRLKCLNWLKSLRPQKQWKPSELDILLLERIANGKSDPQDFQASLRCLIKQLKKLRLE